MQSINFNFRGTVHKAILEKDENNRLVVSLKNDHLETQFGAYLPFYVEDKNVAFETPNKCHSDLYALNSTISRAIAEQCGELL